MPKRSSKKRPNEDDPNVIAFDVVQQATAEDEPETTPAKNPAAVALEGSGARRADRRERPSCQLNAALKSHRWPPRSGGRRQARVTHECWRTASKGSRGDHSRSCQRCGGGPRRGRRYERISLYVASYCKSAGTLVALGAHEIVFGDDGELGPLDVQMHKEDSLWETQSGLTVNTAMTALRDTAYLAWESFFLSIEARSAGGITLRTAAEIAADLTTGLFAPLYSQIDPLHVGEAARAMSVADNYGTRLIDTSKNCNYKGLAHLVTHYPSHSFVIDSKEAKTIFRSVRAPNEAEIALARALDSLAAWPMAQSKTPYISFASSEVAKTIESSEDVAGEEIQDFPQKH